MSSGISIPPALHLLDRWCGSGLPARDSSQEGLIRFGSTKLVKNSCQLAGSVSFLDCAKRLLGAAVP